MIFERFKFLIFYLWLIVKNSKRWMYYISKGREKTLYFQWSTVFVVWVRSSTNILYSLTTHAILPSEFIINNGKSTEFVGANILIGFIFCQFCYYTFSIFFLGIPDPSIFKDYKDQVFCFLTQYIITHLFLYQVFTQLHFCRHFYLVWHILLWWCGYNIFGVIDIEVKIQIIFFKHKFYYCLQKLVINYNL